MKGRKRERLAFSPIKGPVLLCDPWRHHDFMQMNSMIPSNSGQNGRIESSVFVQRGIDAMQRDPLIYWSNNLCRTCREREGPLWEVFPPDPFLEAGPKGKEVRAGSSDVLLATKWAFRWGKQIPPAPYLLFPS